MPFQVAHCVQVDEQDVQMLIVGFGIAIFCNWFCRHMNGAHAAKHVSIFRSELVQCKKL